MQRFRLDPHHTIVRISIRRTPLILALSAFGWAQQPAPQEPTRQDQDTREASQQRKPERGAAREIGSGAGNIGVGAAKGAGDLAKGTAKGVGNLATLHPVNASVSVGKGAVAAGKDVGVGTVKGGAKISKGIGKAFRKIF